MIKLLQLELQRSVGNLAIEIGNFIQLQQLVIQMQLVIQIQLVIQMQLAIQMQYLKKKYANRNFELGLQFESLHIAFKWH